MPQYWQVVRTDVKGRISGETYDQPFPALSNFITDTKELGKDLYAEIYFRDFNSKVVTLGSERLTYVYLKVITYPSGNEEVLVEFSTERTVEEVKANVEACKVPEGYEGRFYSRVIALDFKTGKQVAEVINSLPKTEESVEPTVKKKKEG